MLTNKEIHDKIDKLYSKIIDHQNNRAQYSEFGKRKYFDDLISICQMKIEQLEKTLKEK